MPEHNQQIQLRASGCTSHLSSAAPNNKTGMSTGTVHQCSGALASTVSGNPVLTVEGRVTLLDALLAPAVLLGLAG